MGSSSRPSRRPSLSPMPDLSSYLASMLPVSLQEEAFHRGALLLRKESVYFDDLFPYFFCLLWRREFRTLDLPPISDQEDRVAVLDVLANSYVESDYDTFDDDDDEYSERGGTRTAKFRLFESADVSIEESYLLKRALRGMRHLRCLTLWWAADDAMLNVVGAVCLQLESADFWRSSAVTDLGVKMLLSCDLGSAARAPLCHTLLRLGLKETSCTHVGCLAAVAVCPNLEVLTFSHTAIVKDFFAGVRILNLREDDDDDDDFPLRGNFSLKTLFLPLTNGAHFHEVVSAFPRLEDLRLWTTVGRMDEVSKDDLPSLHSLLLGGLHSSRVLRDLVGAVGAQLTTLKLETVLAPIPLRLVGDHCPNLAELQVINGRLVVGDSNHRCDDPGLRRGFLSKLKLVYLFLVQYDRGHMEHRDHDEELMADDEYETENAPDSMSSTGSYRPRSALHCLLMHATQLEGVQANGCAGMDDDALAQVLKVNPLKNLRR